jgi:hypothetical protein
MGKTIRNVDMVRIHKKLKKAQFIGKVCGLVLSLSLSKFFRKISSLRWVGKEPVIQLSSGIVAIEGYFQFEHLGSV